MLKVQKVTELRAFTGTDPYPALFVCGLNVQKNFVF
jgi:hypothetical protein